MPYNKRFRRGVKQLEIIKENQYTYSKLGDNGGKGLPAGLSHQCPAESSTEMVAPEKAEELNKK